MTNNDINLNPKPTPGPWHVGVGLMICAEDGSPIARCASTRGKFELEEANAHVLAAAWEMRAFLKRLAASGDWYAGALEFRSLADFDGEALERELLMLIAKAEGGAV